jgi:hypothetical protein
VESLGLSFDLPRSFVEAEDPEVLFFAVSRDPQAIFSIAGAAPNVVDYEAAGTESVTAIELTGGVAAVVVIGKSLEGMPPGVISNELLVSNGSSFSVITSAVERDLDAMWSEFGSSVSVQPRR